MTMKHKPGVYLSRSEFLIRFALPAALGIVSWVIILGLLSLAF